MNMTIRFEDLWTVCQKCSGQGEVTTVEGVTNPIAGPGPTTTVGTCQHCQGKRGKPTASGQAIIDLLSRQQRYP
jgi:hypothetical protein